MVIGIGTRYSDFTTASRTIFQNPDVRFVNINVASHRRGQARRSAGAGRRQAHAGGADRRCWPAYSTVAEYQAGGAGARPRRGTTRWSRRFHSGYGEQTRRAGAGRGARRGRRGDGRPRRGGLRGRIAARATCTACGGPGTARGTTSSTGSPAWATRSPAAIGIRMAAPDRDVFVTVGDGSYLMMPTELVTAVQEGIKIIVVLLQNHGYASIGSLAESLGVQRFGTKYRYRNRGIGPAGRRHPAGRPGGQRGQSRREGAQGVDPGGAEGRPGQGQGVGDRRAGARGHRPGVPVARRRRLVGRPGRRGLRPGLHPGRQEHL